MQEECEKSGGGAKFGVASGHLELLNWAHVGNLLRLHRRVKQMHYTCLDVYTSIMYFNIWHPRPPRIPSRGSHTAGVRYDRSFNHRDPVSDSHWEMGVTSLTTAVNHHADGFTLRIQTNRWARKAVSGASSTVVTFYRLKPGVRCWAIFSTGS